MYATGTCTCTCISILHRLNVSHFRAQFAQPRDRAVVAGERRLLVGEDFAVQLGRPRLDVVVVGAELPEHT